MDNTPNQQKSNRARIEVVFEFACPKPKLTIYRGIKAPGGGYRMEKRGELAKKFKSFMWSGAKDGLYVHKRAVENYYRTGTLPFSFLADSETQPTQA